MTKSRKTSRKLQASTGERLPVSDLRRNQQPNLSALVSELSLNFGPSCFPGAWSLQVGTFTVPIQEKRSSHPHNCAACQYGRPLASRLGRCPSKSRRRDSRRRSQNKSYNSESDKRCLCIHWSQWPWCT